MRVSCGEESPLTPTGGVPPGTTGKEVEEQVLGDGAHLTTWRSSRCQGALRCAAQGPPCHAAQGAGEGRGGRLLLGADGPRSHFVCFLRVSG